MAKPVLLAALLAGSLLSLTAVAIWTPANAQAATARGPVSITLPEDAQEFGNGPHLSDAQGFCIGCHSADYVYMQPPLTRTEWHAEVVKMKAVYHCPIEDNRVEAIVDYLMSQRGEGG